MPAAPKITNPLTGNHVTRERATYIRKLRKVRRSARNATRSGHPGRRADARKVLTSVPGLIRQTYIQDAQS